MDILDHINSYASAKSQLYMSFANNEPTYFNRRYARLYVEGFGSDRMRKYAGMKENIYAGVFREVLELAQKPENSEDEVDISVEAAGCLLHAAIFENAVDKALGKIKKEG